MLRWERANTALAETGVGISAQKYRAYDVVTIAAVGGGRIPTGCRSRSNWGTFLVP